MFHCKQWAAAWLSLVFFEYHKILTPIENWAVFSTSFEPTINERVGTNLIYKSPRTLKLSPGLHTAMSKIKYLLPIGHNGFMVLFFVDTTVNILFISDVTFQVTKSTVPFNGLAPEDIYNIEISKNLRKCDWRWDIDSWTLSSLNPFNPLAAGLVLFCEQHMIFRRLLRSLLTKGLKEFVGMTNSRKQINLYPSFLAPRKKRLKETGKNHFAVQWSV